MRLVSMAASPTIRKQTQVYQKLQEHKTALLFTKENLQSAGTITVISWLLSLC
jgi:hypothetical protein